MKFRIYSTLFLLLSVPACAQYRPAPPVSVPSRPALPGSSARLSAPARGVLNPIFLPSDPALKASVQYGREFAKTSKDLIDLLADERRPLETKRGGLLGEKRRAVSVAVWLTPTLEARWRGFLQQRRYSDSTAQAADLQELHQLVTSSQRTLTFLVEIGDTLYPTNGEAPGGQDILAAQKALFERVRGIRFVLSDANDANFLPLPSPTLTPSILPRQQFYDKIAPDPVLLRDPQASSAPVDDDVPGRNRFVKERAAYRNLAAFYVVSFDAFNADGTPRVGPDAKALYLRVITPEGDKSARFDLDKTP